MSSSRHPEPAKSKKDYGLHFFSILIGSVGVFVNLTETNNAWLHYNPFPVHVIQNLRKVKKAMVSNLFFSILIGSVSLSI
jgi:hypothetical protein